MTTPTTAPTPKSPAHTVGLLLLHVGTAAWIGYGAFKKAVEFNPLLLPPPIRDTLMAVVNATSIDAGVFFEWALRAIIGAEVFIALAILLTRWARQIAILTLGFFCIILLIAMVQAGLKDGLKEALTGSCGCFGEAGLPASVMLLVDGILLASAIVLVRADSVRGRVPLWLPAIVGLVAVFAVVKPTVENPDAVGGGASTSGQGSNQGGGGDTGAAGVAPATGIGSPWPSAPAKYEVTYFPKWAEWIGKPFRDQKLALAIERPLPDDIEKGDWIVVFSRPDCENCQALYREHFAEPRKERVLKVSILDTTGKTLPMPCEGCESTQLFRVRAGEQGRTPNYMITAPSLIRLKDGIVTAYCSDAEKADELERVLSPGGPAAGSTASTEASPTDETSTVPPQPAAAAWPGVPAKLEPFYIAEFGAATGKPLSDNPFARLISGKLPDDFLKGRWIIVFYREDCDHCHEMLMTYFTGKLPVRTLAIAIPDTDPAAALDNPCDECVKMSLVKGPNYVIGTPVVLAIQDGVVECVVDNAEDIALLEGCLKFPAR